MVQISLYHIPSALKEITFDQAYSLLNEEEQASAARMKAERRLHEFVLGRYQLKNLLAEKLKTAPSSITFQKRKHGKLYLDNSPVFFNLTHSGEYLGIGISEKYEIGIDIEHITRRGTDISGIAERYFTKAESHTIETAPKERKTALFYEAWTKKEAVLKATGIGISGGLNSFNAFECTETSMTTLATDETSQQLWLKHWPLKTLENQPSLYLSAAVCGSQTCPAFELKTQYPS